MYQSCVFQHTQRIKQLFCEYADKTCAKASECVLLNEFVKVGGQELEDEAQMSTMYKSIFEPQNMVLVLRVVSQVELSRTVSEHLKRTFFRRQPSLTISRMVISIMLCW